MYVLSVCLFVVFSPFTLGVNYFQCNACCTFDGPGWEHMEYTVRHFYNKKLGMLYNSTTGNYTGFTEYGIHVAHVLQNDPYGQIARKIENDLMCKDRLFVVKDLDVGMTCCFLRPFSLLHFVRHVLFELFLDSSGLAVIRSGGHLLFHIVPGNFTVAPTVKVTRVMHPSGLLCSAYDFYPKQIRVMWFRNGQEVVSFTEAIPDGDWYYQIHSYLEYTPTPGQTISCVVEHTSLHEPLIQVWDSSLPKSQRIIDGVGTFFLVLGLVCMSVGFIYYKRKSAAPLTLCRGREMVPVEVVPVAGAL
ncbi:rano class II histocompatibility antigen, A beta chain-like isoform X1 [Sphaeramia orbicularis]|uniref:rano class II histocompatibility antigen, A beta chain-like isoform X1 n=1 Tax=Sphaeramia orbicularis TaxID=375764 RepID=UPI001181579B|nr:rano class II histocompatibility antigen, A beta chain-like isoform X1 [Sphaeramia orbicularis]XP_029996503.1 rano class II histocompatibility antigen, A beta chain-like isoform X1 [Sphaeramia orbicularis]